MHGLTNLKICHYVVMEYFYLTVAYSCILRPSYKAMNFHICIVTYCFNDGLV